MADSVLLLAALVLAPIIGGGLGELASGIIEILVLGALMVRLVVTRPKGTEWARAPGLVPLGVFFLAVCVSTIFSESIYASLREVIYLAACLGAYALSSSVCRDPRIAAAAVWALVLTALGICIVGVRDYAISTGGGAAFWKSLLGSGTHDRLFGTFINPGFFAGYLVVVLPISMGVYLVTRKSLLAFVAGIAVVMETVALMLTGTKFGIVAAVASLLVLFVLAIATGSLKRARFRRLIAIALVLTPLLVIFAGPITSRIGEAEAGGTQVHSTEFRVYTWQATMNMVRANPWLGVGPGAFEFAYPRYTIAGPTKNAHQSYLQIAAESGVIALAAFVLALLSVAYGALDGTIRRMREGTTNTQATPDESIDSASGITWKDLVPYSGWRMISCAIFAALAGSAVRNLADSDWFLMGISLPFCVMMGLLVSQSGAASRDVAVRRPVRIGLSAMCVAMIVLAISFGLGDVLAPDDFGPSRGFEQMLQGYRAASRVSPLNPKYHRELGKYLFAAGDTEGAIRQIDRAIALAPRDSGGYVVRAMIAAAVHEPAKAISFYQKALKYNPNSTSTLYRLALVKRDSGDMAGYESALTQLLRIEESDYEKIKGVPELVDTTFAYAHAYFGEKNMARKRYARAIDEFTSAIDRLETWRSNKQALRIARFSGTLTREEEHDLLDVLRRCYLGLAEAYSASGDPRNAQRARAKAESVAGDGTAGGESAPD